MIDWIQGEKFKALADFTYSPVMKMEGDYDNLPNTFDTARLKDMNVVYTHTMYAKQLFEIIKELPQKFIIITHNSDVNVDDSFSLPNNVIKWFSQNVNVIHERIESIPIGLENDMWFKSTHKKEKMIAKLKEPHKYKNLVYVNHNVATNPAKRLKPYELLYGAPWATCERGANGDKFDEYLDNIYNHKFVICPEGNGIDTHRIWECLYMGSIPIAERNINNKFYDLLPILTVSNWEDVIKPFLQGWESWSRGFEWDKRMLTFEYWKNRILNEVKQGGNI